ncbi:ShlB/FhaC/HecB family hemolysin secretion/activation protein, partial [Proteus mirabilis]|nr:ShlB/FhaC/HecB family hemolysin secretion/activation protein [Proteus mirabilis]
IILKGILKHKKVRTELAKQPILINSPTLTSLSLAPQYHFNLTSGYLSINPSAEIGLSFFGHHLIILLKTHPEATIEN